MCRLIERWSSGVLYAVSMLENWALAQRRCYGLLESFGRDQSTPSKAATTLFRPYDNFCGSRILCSEKGARALSRVFWFGCSCWVTASSKISKSIWLSQSIDLHRLDKTEWKFTINRLNWLNAYNQSILVWSEWLLTSLNGQHYRRFAIKCRWAEYNERSSIVHS